MPRAVGQGSWYVGLLLLAFGALAMLVFRDALALLWSPAASAAQPQLENSGELLRLHTRLDHIEHLLYELGNRSTASAILLNGIQMELGASLGALSPVVTGGFSDCPPMK